MPWKIVKTTHHYWLPDDYKDEIAFVEEYEVCIDYCDEQNYENIFAT